MKKFLFTLVAAVGLLASFAFTSSQNAGAAPDIQANRALAAAAACMQPYRSLGGEFEARLVAVGDCLEGRGGVWVYEIWLTFPCNNPSDYPNCLYQRPFLVATAASDCDDRWSATCQ